MDHKNHHFHQNLPKFHIFHPKSTVFARGRAFCGVGGSKKWLFSSKVDRICTRACILWTPGLQNLTFLIQNRPDLHAGVHFLQNHQNWIEIDPILVIFDQNRSNFGDFCKITKIGSKSIQNLTFLTKIDRICTRACSFLEVTRFRDIGEALGIIILI